jgi:hypothetical protein
MLVAKAMFLIVLAVNEGLSPSFIDLRNGLIHIHARRTAAYWRSNEFWMSAPKTSTRIEWDASLARVNELISVFPEARVGAIIFVEPNANGAKQRK